MTATSTRDDSPRVFNVVLIRPTRYDDDGYPVHWRHSPLPSNSLACLYGIAADCRERRVLGEDVEIRIDAFDETNTVRDTAQLIRSLREAGRHALIGLVGVQTHQFPRALDLARQFRAAGIPVCIGGFHVSGCLAMLETRPPELDEALDLGVSLFAGELEAGRFDAVLRDAFAGSLQPIYDLSGDLPPLAGQPLPHLPPETVERNLRSYSSFDLGRGCPFACSFCCIINVQGRKSRYRTVDDLEKIVRMNHAMGVVRCFVTDDDFARNANWEACLDRLIELRDLEGIKLRLTIQVDVRSHKIPGFIEKCGRAGVDEVFIGLESVNADNLKSINKKQNRIADYREMILEWKKHNIIVMCGYIIGLPHDTADSIIDDIETVKRELPVDVLFMTCLTPLPGSADHKRHVECGQWIEPDLNKFDLSHRVVHHPKMADAEFDKAYRKAHSRYYTLRHMLTVMRRAAALGSDKKYSTVRSLVLLGVLMRMKTGSFEGGFVRVPVRKGRRWGTKPHHPLIYYPKFYAAQAVAFVRFYVAWYGLRYVARRIWNDPKRFAYTDDAIAPLAARATARARHGATARQSQPPPTTPVAAG